MAYSDAIWRIAEQPDLDAEDLLWVDLCRITTKQEQAIEIQMYKACSGCACSRGVSLFRRYGNTS